MVTRRLGTRTPLERLRAHLDATERRCPDCGYEDPDGSWTASTTGGRVEYARTCPSCGAVRTRTIRLRGSEPAPRP